MKKQHVEKESIPEVINQTTLTPFVAMMIVESDYSDLQESLQAWAYLIKTRLCWQLQGWYGRNAANLIEQNLITKDGEICWHMVDSILHEQEFQSSLGR